MEFSVDTLLHVMQQDETAAIKVLGGLGQSERHLLAAKLQALALLAVSDEMFVPVLVSEPVRLRIHIRIPAEPIESPGPSS